MGAVVTACPGVIAEQNGPSIICLACSLGLGGEGFVTRQMDQVQAHLDCLYCQFICSYSCKSNEINHVRQCHFLVVLFRSISLLYIL